MFCWGSASSRKHTQQEFHTPKTPHHKTPTCRSLTDATPGNAAANTSGSTTSKNEYARLAIMMSVVLVALVEMLAAKEVVLIPTEN